MGLLLLHQFTGLGHGIPGAERLGSGHLAVTNRQPNPGQRDLRSLYMASGPSQGVPELESTPALSRISSIPPCWA